MVELSFGEYSSVLATTVDVEELLLQSLADLMDCNYYLLVMHLLLEVGNQKVLLLNAICEFVTSLTTK